MRVQDSLIELQSISKTFRKKGRKQKEVHALKNVSLRLNKGEIAGLLGPNGAGKTSLIKTLCGLVYPDQGRVLAFGQPFERVREKALSKMGVLLEGHRHIFWPLTVHENLRYFGMLKNIPKEKLQEESQRLIRFMGLENKRDVPVRFLSQGMRQKLSLSVTLLGDPEVLLLDEPTHGLDVESLRDLKQTIVKLAKEFHKAILLSTHQMEVAQDLSDRVLILEQGRLLADAPIHELVGYFKGRRFWITFKNSSLRGLGDPSFLRLLNGQEPALGLVDAAAELGVYKADVRVQDGEELYEALKELKSKGCEILEVEECKRSLEEVFLEIVKEQKGLG